jgi:hypothetical protein
MAKRMPSRRRQPPPEPPTCNCVLLCDDVATSTRGKHTLVGIIGVIGSSSFPAWLGGYVAYVRLSNVYASQTVRICLERAEDREEVLALDVQLNQPDPLGVCTVMVVLPPFRIDRPGRYLFQVRSEGIPLAESPIRIVQARAPGAQT